MSKAVLISTRPKWCELIANDKKPIEVRKTRPKIKTPFKCLIYCTQPKYPHEDFITIGAGTENARAFYGGGKVIGEFVCDRIERYVKIGCTTTHSCYALCDNENRVKELPLEQMQLTYEEFDKYAAGKEVFGWHISDLVIYDKPKELSEFHRPCTPACNYSEECGGTNAADCVFGISRPPQSWCYVEVYE